MSVEEVAGVSPRREAKQPTPVEGGWAPREHASVSPDGSSGRSEAGGRGPVALELVSTLCRALDSEGVEYCHWKSNEALDRSASGENDLDLLVSRAHAQRFEAILRGLGFRDAELARWKRLPGVFHSYALDEPSGKFVHVHAQYQLVIGDDMTKGYRLPIEGPYLDSAVQGGLFRVPAPEFELAVFLVRMVLKHSSWDAIVCLQGSLSASERRELDDLVGRMDLDQVWAVMGRHLPFVSEDLWRRCLRSVQPGASLGFRIRTARWLQRTLVPCSRRRRPVDTSLKVWRRSRILVRRKLLRRGPDPERPAGGGALIAIVGGDGAGKTTAVEDLTSWLSEEFSTFAVHLGKPPRSVLSASVKGLMGLAASVRRSPTWSATELKTSLAADGDGSLGARSAARLAWETLTARDRYRAYRRARRLATNGSIVVCDRFPLPQVRLMDGAVTAQIGDPSRLGRFAARLARLERSFYDRISYPDILFVLRVSPDLAVQRKLGVERESFLRPRSEEIWRMDWRDTPAIVIDAGRPKAEVLSAIRSAVWSRL